MDLSVPLEVMGQLTQLFTVALLLPPDDEDDDDEQRSLPSRRTGWQDLWPAVPIRCTKTHCVWMDRSACPCFIDLTPHKFTTSAFLVLHLTGERFSGGMRSDRGREMEGKGRRRGRVRREGE